jgi:hypothetical protein
MNCRIIIVGTIVALLYLWVFRREGEVSAPAKEIIFESKKPSNMSTTKEIIEDDSTMNYRVKIRSFLTQAGFTTITAENMYEKYKTDHPNVSDRDMYNNMKEKYNEELHV